MMSPRLDLALIRISPLLLIVTILSVLGERAALASPPADEGPPLVRLEVEPAETILDGQRAHAQIIVTGHFADGSVRDLSREAVVRGDADLVQIETGGWLSPIRDGKTTLTARVGSHEAQGSVEVRDSGTAHPIQFAHEVLPALTKAGCNQGACHGTPSGKNGFRLSLRGYDPALDFMTLTREVGTRRTNPIEPEASLILLKGTGAIDHQGGQRFTNGCTSRTASSATGWPRGCIRSRRIPPRWSA